MKPNGTDHVVLNLILQNYNVNFPVLTKHVLAVHLRSTLHVICLNKLGDDSFTNPVNKRWCCRSDISGTKLPSDKKMPSIPLCFFCDMPQHVS